MAEAIVRITFNRELLEEKNLDLESEISSMIDSDELDIFVDVVEELS